MAAVRRRPNRAWAVSTAEAMQSPTLTHIVTTYEGKSPCFSPLPACRFLPAPSTWGLQTEKITSSLMMDGQNLYAYQMITTRRLMGEIVALSSSCWNGTSEMLVAFCFPASEWGGRDRMGETSFSHFCKFSIPTVTTCCTRTTSKLIRKLEKTQTTLRANCLR